MGSTVSQEIYKDCPSEFSPSYKLGAMMKENVSIKHSPRRDKNVFYSQVQKCTSSKKFSECDAIIKSRKSCFSKLPSDKKIESHNSNFCQFASKWNQETSQNRKHPRKTIHANQQIENAVPNIVNSTIKGCRFSQPYPKLTDEEIVKSRDCPYTTYTYYEPVTIFEKIPKIPMKQMKQEIYYPQKAEMHQEGRSTINGLSNNYKIKNNFFSINSDVLNECKSTRDYGDRRKIISNNENSIDKRKIRVQKIYKNEDHEQESDIKKSYSIDNCVNIKKSDDNIYRYQPNTCNKKFNFDYKQILNEMKQTEEKKNHALKTQNNKSQSININIPSITFQNSPSHTLYLESNFDKNIKSSFNNEHGYQNISKIMGKCISKKASLQVVNSISEKLASKNLKFTRKTKENMKN